MASQRLFSVRERVDPHPARGAETTFEFLDRVAGPFWDRLRELQDAWFADYPATDAGDLGQRFRSRGQLQSAWWELYLYTLLTRTGRRVTPHPELPGTLKRPDFLVEEDTGERWLLEATTFATDEASVAQRQADIVDALNSIESPNLFVNIKWRETGSASLPLRPMKERVTAWLASIDADALLLLTNPQRDDFPRLTWEHEDWTLIFEAMPWKREARGKGNRTVGAQFLAGRFLDDGVRAQRALDGKAAKYGELPLPFVVAFRFLSMSTDVDDFVAVDADGHLRIRGGVRLQRRVSALLAAGPDFQPWSICNITPLTIVNGAAERQLKPALPWPAFGSNDDWRVAECRPRRDLDAVLGVPPDFEELHRRPFRHDAAE